MRYLTLDLSRESKSRATSEMCCHSVVISLLFDELIKDWLQKRSSLSGKRKGRKKKKKSARIFSTVALSPVDLEFSQMYPLYVWSFLKASPESPLIGWRRHHIWTKALPHTGGRGSANTLPGVLRQSLRGIIQLGFLCCQVDRAFTWDPTSIVESIFHLVGQKAWLAPHPSVFDRLLFSSCT